MQKLRQAWAPRLTRSWILRRGANLVKNLKLKRYSDRSHWVSRWVNFHQTCDFSHVDLFGSVTAVKRNVLVVTLMTLSLEQNESVGLLSVHRPCTVDRLADKAVALQHVFLATVSPVGLAISGEHTSRSLRTLSKRIYLASQCGIRYYSASSWDLQFLKSSAAELPH
jgi:hypothetical protein